MSLAWKHRDRVRRQKAASAAKAAVTAAEGREIARMAGDKQRHELLLTQLEADCKRISELPQGSAREPLKRELVKSYLPLVEAYISSGEEFRNVVLTQLLVWLFDLGEIDRALKLAAVAIDQNQPMPERYKRDVRTFTADAVIEWSKAQQAAGNPAEPYFSAMLEQVLQWQVHDVIKIKYLKFAAVEAREQGEIERALDYCLQAEDIDPAKAKVKTMKAELEKELAVKAEAEQREQAKPAAEK